MSAKARLDENPGDHNHRYYVLDDPSVGNMEYDPIPRTSVWATSRVWVRFHDTAGWGEASDAFAEVVRYSNVIARKCVRPLRLRISIGARDRLDVTTIR